MIAPPWLIYAPATLVLGLGARAWASYRFNSRKRREASLPIVDPFLLEVVFSPRKANPDDDEAVLDEMKRIVARVNQQSRSDEFNDSSYSLGEYYNTLSPASRLTAHRAIIRLIESGNNRLQLLGARVAARLSLPEMVAPLRRLQASLPPNEGEPNQSWVLPDELARAIRLILEPD